MITPKDTFIKLVEREIMQGPDGHWYYWPPEVGVAYTAWQLRTIADEVDRRNPKLTDDTWEERYNKSETP